MPNERTLQLSELRYRRVFEAAHDGILILNADTGRIEDANPFMTELLGYSHEQFLGRHLWEIGLFKDIEQSKTAFRELQEKGYIRYEDLPLQDRTAYTGKSSSSATSTTWEIRRPSSAISGTSRNANWPNNNWHIFRPL